MRIFFTASRTGMKIYSKAYNAVLKELKEQRTEVFATIEQFEYLLAERQKMLSKRVFHFKKEKYAADIIIRQEIAKADAVVIEASYPSFRLGFEAFYALTLQKPTLVLSKERDFSNIIDQPHFFGAKYNDFTLPDEIEKFIKHVKEYKLRTRFNMFITEKHKEKLEKRAKHFGVSMSDYIRKLIEKDVGI